MKNGTLYALGLGAAYLWWRSRAAAPSPAADVALPQITPAGAPPRDPDNPLGPEEQAAINAGAAYLDKNGWMKYVGYDEKSTSGSVSW